MLTLVLQVMLPVAVPAKPCPVSASSDSLLAIGNVARDIAGTRRVALDASGACLEIDVATPGTARLVGLLLRSFDVPDEAVRLRVVA